MNKGLKKYLTDKNCRFRVNAVHGLYNWMPDDMYLKKLYKAWMGKELDLEHPRTLNEKIQWLKIHDHSPVYPQLVDKYGVKEFVGNLIGKEHIIPTFGVWDRFEDIDFEKLPDQFVLKCTHDSHGLVICKDKSKLNMESAKKKLNRALHRKYYKKFREWPYKEVKPRIIAEEYVEDESGFLTDYKFYCFHGVPDCVLTCFDRMTGNTRFFFFDRNWELKRYNKQGKEAPEGFTKPKPEGIEKMFDLAEILAKASGAPFIRVDFYNAYGRIYFGELTLYPAAGFDTGRLPETDILFGDKLNLDVVAK
ncbi:MAG: glycosyl transferase [Clostridia bacterium]|nr:glycosyl transferase [Clostridia bacterium]